MNDKQEKEAASVILRFRFYTFVLIVRSVLLGVTLGFLVGGNLTGTGICLTSYFLLMFWSHGAYQQLRKDLDRLKEE